jgi:N-methylhydantoinase A
VVDLVEIGTGGGSIAFINEAGHLNVGPRSSGAAPGPACYGLGGSEPAITDADVVLGRLSAEHFAGGRMRLDVKAAERAIERCIAAPLGMSVIRAAESIVALANAQMVRALELVSVERGFDPRSFALVAFGGAGPMHAAELAVELRCPRAIIPLSPGVQSAWGLLVADARRDFSRTILRNRGAIDLAYLRKCHEAMAAQGGRDLVEAGFDSTSIQSRLALGARYVGQAYEVIVEIPGPYSFDEKMRGEIDSLFHAEHRRLYGYASSGAPVEWVTLRTTVISKIPYPEPRKIPPADLPLNVRTLGRQPMIWNGRPFDAPVFHRSALGCGDRMTGPLLVVQDDTSIPVPPGVELSVVETGDIILETERSA